MNIKELINLRQNNSVFLIFSFPCICGENWFCRRSVATFQSDVIQAPLKGPFCYDIKDQGPFFMRQISALFPSTKNIFPVATKSISSRRYQLFRIRRSSSLSWRHVLFPLRRSSPDGALSFLLEPSRTGARLDLTHILCNPFQGLRPGAGQDLRLFSSYLYIPGHTAVLSCQKEHKKDRDPLSQSFPVSLTTKYRTVTGRNVPL